MLNHEIFECIVNLIINDKMTSIYYADAGYIAQYHYCVPSFKVIYFTRENNVGIMDTIGVQIGGTMANIMCYRYNNFDIRFTNGHLLFKPHEIMSYNTAGLLLKIKDIVENTLPLI